MQDTAQRFAAASEVRGIGEVLADACEQTVPFGSFGYAVMEPTVAAEPCMVMRSNEFPIDWCLRRFPEILVAIEHDLGGLAAALSEPHAYDGYEKFPLSKYWNTSLVQDHWRVIRCDQQLVAPFWHGGVPVGYFAVVRSRREARFTADDLRRVEGLRALAERSLRGVASLGPGDLAQTLDALTQAFPYPAFLFNAAGKLAWMSDEGAVRLCVRGARLGDGRFIRGASLEGLASYAAEVLTNDGSRIEARLRAAGVLRGGERVAVRRFCDGLQPFVLVAVVPALARVPGEFQDPHEGSVPGLGAVESRVARLAAAGRTIAEIARTLAVAETTVRTHLSRVYVKLGVHGRAELVCALMKGSARDANVLNGVSPRPASNWVAEPR